MPLVELHLNHSSISYFHFGVIELKLIIEELKQLRTNIEPIEIGVNSIHSVIDLIDWLELDMQIIMLAN